MNLALALLAGGGLGAGCWLLLAAVVPARPSLAASLALLRASPAASAGAGRHPSPSRRAWEVQVGRAVEQVGQALGLEFRSLRKDLAVAGQPLEAHLAAKVLYAVIGGLVGPVVAGLLVLGGVPAPLVLPLWLGLGLAVIGWLLPDRRLRAAAAARRASLRYAAGALLNLVAITWPAAPRSSSPSTTPCASATAGRSRCFATPCGAPS